MTTLRFTPTLNQATCVLNVQTIETVVALAIHALALVAQAIVVRPFAPTTVAVPSTMSVYLWSQVARS
jgi:hypothetical protein